jgi:hypothetical protein
LHWAKMLPPTASSRSLLPRAAAPYAPKRYFLHPQETAPNSASNCPLQCKQPPPTVQAAAPAARQKPLLLTEKAAKKAAQPAGLVLFLGRLFPAGKIHLDGLRGLNGALPGQALEPGLLCRVGALTCRRLF